MAEGLSRFILVAKAVGSFKGIPISEVLFITHLLFVDDILIFCDDTHHDIIKLKEGLLLLQVATGMLVNDDKSTIFYSNLDDREIIWHSSLFPFKSLRLEDGLKNLGFFYKPNAYCVVVWMWLLEKFEKSFLGWSFRWLSRASKLVLIKSVLEAISVFWISLS